MCYGPMQRSTNISDKSIIVYNATLHIVAWANFADNDFRRRHQLHART